MVKILNFATSCRHQGSWEEDGRPGMEVESWWTADGIFFRVSPPQGRRLTADDQNF